MTAGISGQHSIARLPVLVVFPHNRCNCRCVMCDIWRIREKQEITSADIDLQLASIRTLGVEWIVFSGGEPQLHSDLRSLAQPLREAGVRLTLLTAGLLLGARSEETTQLFDDIIVSLDGPPDVHDAIRRIPGAFARLARGIDRVRHLRPDMPIAGRCTVQKQNHAVLRETVATARRLALDSISFLSVDTTSTAFNRADAWTISERQAVALNAIEADALSCEIDLLIAECSAEIACGFIRENAVKLRRIVQHFQAELGQAPTIAPPCNAPWVSAVIEADGSVRPCFFHEKIGNIREQTLIDILNGEAAISFRSNLDIATNPICRRCVCSLHLQHRELPENADAIVTGT